MRAYTRLVGWSVRHKYRHLPARPRASSPPRSARRTSCPSASCRRATMARSLFVVELPPGSRLDDTKAGDRPACGAPARDAGSALRLRQRRRAASGQEGGAARDLTVELCAEGRARASAAPARGAASPACSATCRTSASSRSTTTASAALQLIVSRTRPGRRHRDGGEAAARDGDDPDLSNAALDGAAEPARDPHPAEARARGRARRLDRRRSPRRCASAPSATSARTSPSSMPATGRCRSACSCPRACAATVGCIDC